MNLTEAERKAIARIKAADRAKKSVMSLYDAIQDFSHNHSDWIKEYPRIKKELLKLNTTLEEEGLL